MSQEDFDKVFNRFLLLIVLLGCVTAINIWLRNNPPEPIEIREGEMCPLKEPYKGN